MLQILTCPELLLKNVLVSAGPISEMNDRRVEGAESATFSGARLKALCKAHYHVLKIHDSREQILI